MLDEKLNTLIISEIHEVVFASILINHSFLIEYIVIQGGIISIYLQITVSTNNENINSYKLYA